MANSFVQQLLARPHMLASVIAGSVVAAAASLHEVSALNLLYGWNTAVWLYLVQAAWVMSRHDHHHLRRTAIAQAEGAGVVLTIAIAAVAVSMAAIAFVLGGVKGLPTADALRHVAFTLFTVAGAWLLLPTLFSLNYASHLHTKAKGEGLQFPGDPDAPGQYWDFLYFSFTIAVACQTADVVITTTAMRRLVLMHEVLSFVFNTAILALTVNIAASLL